MPFGGFCPLPIRLGGDATAGWTASEHARAAADLVAIKRTSPLAWFTWAAVGSASTPAVIAAYCGMNGVGSAFRPTATASSNRLIFDWSPGRFTDDYQVSAPVMPRVIHVTFAGTTYRKATILTRVHGVEISAWDAAGTIVNPQPGGTCVIW